MRVSKQEKAESRDRIVRNAARLVRRSGIDGASVGDIMKEAGLTHGGFYRHFATKDELVETALNAAFDEIAALLDDVAAAPAAADSAFRTFYLSDRHRDNAEQGCPAAALAAEVGRASERVRAAFGRGVTDIVSKLAHGKAGSDEGREAAAYREFAMMAGAVALARASDGETAGRILSACREGLD